MFLILLVSGLVPLAGCSSSGGDMSKLKEELKQEILAELRQQGRIADQDMSQEALAPARQEVHPQEKSEADPDPGEKIGSDVKGPNQAIADVSVHAADHSWEPQSHPVGKAAGYILRGGKGLEGCKVKLVRMLTGQSAIETFSAVREGVQFVTMTDAEGRYAFDGIPVGSYKLKWQLPGDQAWIRRLRDKPDVVISEGQTIIVKSVETNRRLAGP